MKKLLGLSLILPTLVLAEPVTVDTFVRAESDTMIRANMKMMGVQIGKFAHLRQPTTPENQPVIRMNQDTLYSGTVLDLSKPVQITLPEAGGRYMSMQVVSQDHYMLVESGPGTYPLTEEQVGTRFALLTVRTFVDITDPEDIAEVHALQDANTDLTDHTVRAIAWPNDDTLYVAAMVDVTEEPIVMELPAFDSKYASLMVTA